MMKKKLVGLLSTALLCSAMVMPVSAASVQTGNSTASVATIDKTTAGTEQCDVKVNLATNFTVTIPKTITLNGNKANAATYGKSDYQVSVKGDIDGTSVISVMPAATFNMSQPNKADVNASVTQAKKNFKVSTAGDGFNSVTDVGGVNATTPVTSNGTVAATTAGLSAGSWTGAFNFVIDMQ